MSTLSTPLLSTAFPLPCLWLLSCAICTQSRENCSRNFAPLIMFENQKFPSVLTQRITLSMSEYLRPSILCNFSISQAHVSIRLLEAPYALSYFLCSANSNCESRNDSESGGVFSGGECPPFFGGLSPLSLTLSLTFTLRFGFCGLFSIIFGLFRFSFSIISFG